MKFKSLTGKYLLIPLVVKLKDVKHNLSFMNIRKLLPLFALSILVSCAISKTSQGIKQADLLFEQQEFAKALTQYNFVIETFENKGKQADGKTYARAGISAFKTGNTEEAITFFDKARYEEYTSDAMHYYHAKSYLSIDNLSKEMTALETLVNNYPNSPYYNEGTQRLMETYVESKNWELGISMYRKLKEDEQDKTRNLELYLQLCAGSNKQGEADKVAQRLLNRDSKNITALGYLGEKYYWMAENSYLKEMKAYKKNRTQKQYKILLKALDECTTNYKKSRDYLRSAYHAASAPNKSYANYLSRIYLRLEDKEKAAFWESKSN